MFGAADCVRALQHELKKDSSHEALLFNSDVSTVREKTVMDLSNQIGFSSLDCTCDVSGLAPIQAVPCVSGEPGCGGTTGSSARIHLERALPAHSWLLSQPRLRELVLKVLVDVSGDILTFISPSAHRAHRCSQSCPAAVRPGQLCWV